MTSPDHTQDVTPPNDVSTGPENLDGAWRDKRTFVVRRGGDVSRLCLRCGSPSDGKQIVKPLYYNSGGRRSVNNAPAEGILGFLYLIVVVISFIGMALEYTAAQSRIIKFGLCPQHRRLRRRYKVGAWTGILLGIALLALGIIILVTGAGGSSNIALGVTLIIVSIISVVIGAVCISLIPGPFLYGKKGDQLWVGGACEAFLSSCNASPPPPKA